MDKQKKLKLASISCFITFIGYTAGYELFLHDKITSTEIVVPNRMIEANEIIKADDLTLKRYSNDLLSKTVIKDPSKVIGQRAVGTIEPNEFLTKNKVDSPKLTMSEDESLLSIPESWMESVPYTIRRLDSVDISLVVEPNMSTKIMTSDEFKLEDKVVAYVKSQQNKEVRGLASDKDRMDSEQAPQRLEVILTNDEIKELVDKVEKGYKLLITYKGGIR